MAPSTHRTSLSVRHLVGIKDLTESDIQLILDTAGQFKEVINRPIKKVPSLRDVTLTFQRRAAPSKKAKPCWIRSTTSWR
jgi:ornithine carbamoyltransferase